MKIFYDSKEVVRIAFSPFVSKTIQKQEVAEYLMEERDMLILEKLLIMSYLPFIRTIAAKKRHLSEENLEKNQIELVFEGSSMANPSNVILEVSQELYEFLTEE